MIARPRTCQRCMLSIHGRYSSQSESSTSTNLGTCFEHSDMPAIPKIDELTVIQTLVWTCTKRQALVRNTWEIANRSSENRKLLVRTRGAGNRNRSHEIGCEIDRVCWKFMPHTSSKNRFAERSSEIEPKIEGVQRKRSHERNENYPEARGRQNAETSCF